MPNLVTPRVGLAEDLQRLVLRRRRECEVARVREHFAAVDKRVDLVLDAVRLIVVGSGQGSVQR